MDHNAGNCAGCGLIHSVPGAVKENIGPHQFETGLHPRDICSRDGCWLPQDELLVHYGASGFGNYTSMISRAQGEPDPLVKEPKK